MKPVAISVLWGEAGVLWPGCARRTLPEKLPCRAAFVRRTVWMATRDLDRRVTELLRNVRRSTGSDRAGSRRELLRQIPRLRRARTLSKWAVWAERGDE